MWSGVHHQAGIPDRGFAKSGNLYIPFRVSIRLSENVLLGEPSLYLVICAFDTGEDRALSWCDKSTATSHLI